MPETLKFYRRNLPHWLVADAAYFVTIRLSGTLPREVVAALKREQLQAEEDEYDKQQWIDLRRKQFVKIASILDATTQSARDLDGPLVARAVMNAMEWLRKNGWVIYAATILTTHMHLLLRNQTGRSSEMLKDIGRFKNYTARECNRVLGREGSFWAREQFDHWIRKPEKFEGVVRYIAMNPVKAGRVSGWKEWPWTVVDESVLYCLDMS